MMVFLGLAWVACGIAVFFYAYVKMEPKGLPAVVLWLFLSLFLWPLTSIFLFLVDNGQGSQRRPRSPFS